VASEGFLGWMQVTISRRQQFITYLGNVFRECHAQDMRDLRHSTTDLGSPCCKVAGALHALHTNEDSDIW
jgi:hypothetical protein